MRAGYAGGGDMSQVELKPCPFCGGEASLSTVGRSWYRITADHEGFCILEEHESDCPQTDEQLALLVRDWNARVGSELDQLKAENESLRKDAERWRWLRDQKPNSFSVSRNEDHAPNYMTAEQWIDNVPEEFKYVDEFEVQRMKESNTIWALQIYPNTPVGFNKYYAATLDVLIDDEISGKNDQ